MSQYSNLDFSPIQGAFLGAYEANPAGLWASRVANIYENVSHETLKYIAVGASKGLTEWVGTRQIKSLKGYSINLTNKRFEDGFSVPVDAVRRDSLGLFASKAVDMAEKAQYHWNELLVNLIVANGNGPDGLPFFSSTRKPDSINTSSNVVTGSDIDALTVTDATKPTAVEAANILLSLIGKMQTFIDESGKVATGGARSFTVLVRTINHWAAFQSAASATQLANGQTNPVMAALLGNGYNVRIVQEPGIGGTSDIYMLRDDGASEKPFILQSENGIEFQQIVDPNDSFVVNNDEYFWGLKTNRSAGFARYDYALKATLESD